MLLGPVSASLGSLGRDKLGMRLITLSVLGCLKVFFE